MDRDDPDAGRRTAAFRARVLGERERGYPEELLWHLWAAKEAAYKIVAGQRSGAVFAHARFEVDLEGGVVRYGGEVFPVTWQERGACLSCVGGQAAEVLSAVDEGGDARDLARRLLASRLGWRCEDVAIVRAPRTGSWDGFGPPEVRWRGERVPDVGVSLSQHGRYRACAVGLG